MLAGFSGVTAGTQLWVTVGAGGAGGAGGSGGGAADPGARMLAALLAELDGLEGGGDLEFCGEVLRLESMGIAIRQEDTTLLEKIEPHVVAMNRLVGTYERG